MDNVMRHDTTCLTKFEQPSSGFFYQATIALLVLLLLSLTTNTAAAETKKEDNPFSKLIGNWSIQDYGKDKDGNWQPAGGADWNFYWILNGAAIQDDWIAPSLSKPEPKTGRQLGTNIRIFNPKENQWEMAWVSNSGQKLETFTAKNVGSNVVMSGNYQGQPTRITFFNIRKNTFSWKMERQALNENKQPNGTWQVIYKIEGTRVTSE